MADRAALGQFRGSGPEQSRLTEFTTSGDGASELHASEAEGSGTGQACALRRLGPADRQCGGGSGAQRLHWALSL